MIRQWIKPELGNVKLAKVEFDDVSADAARQFEAEMRPGRSAMHGRRRSIPTPRRFRRGRTSRAISRLSAR